tara:strand:- start:385 stop:666 length:282 start_codon:yes stop_codon:yes gene_type:complete
MDSYLVEVIDEDNESCVIINFAESIHELVDNVVCMENFRYIKKIKRQSDQKDIKLVNNEIDLEELRAYRILIDDEVELRNTLINNEDKVDNIQ